MTRAAAATPWRVAQPFAVGLNGVCDDATVTARERAVNRLSPPGIGACQWPVALTVVKRREGCPDSLAKPCARLHASTAR
jgi:hypothetical protein